MTLFNLLSFIGVVALLLVIIFYIVACISVERTKIETIRIREILEKIYSMELSKNKRETPAESIPENHG